VTKAVQSFTPLKFDILQVRPMTEVPGLTEVVLRIDRQTLVIYLDRTGKHVIAGNITEIATKNNLTLATQQKFAVK
jgi:hypothetical protein